MGTIINKRTLEGKGFKKFDLCNNVIWYERDNIILDKVPNSLGGMYVLRKRIDENNSEYLGIIRTWEELDDYRSKL